MADAPSLGHRARSWSATWRQVRVAEAWSGCTKAWRMAAATTVVWLRGTWARAFLMKCTRQRCQVAPARLRAMAASSPSWASEMTSLVPFRPRFASVLRNALQNVSASEGPMCSPTISCLRTDLRFAPPVGVHGHRDYGRHGDDAPALADLQIGGVEPQVGPLALQGAPQKGPDPLVDGEPWVAIGPRAMASAELGDGGLRDPAHAHRLDEVVDLARRDAGDPSLLDDGHQRLLDGLSRLQEPWEARAVAPGADEALDVTSRS